MAAYAPPDWHAWFPPALDETTAAAIADAYYDRDPHEAAALAWEAYAATLPPSGPAVTSVNTGAQTVTYDPPTFTGDAGAALARAAWHRAQGGSLFTVALGRGEGPRGPLRDMSWWVDP